VDQLHWILAVIDFESSAIHLLDSWKPTQQANAKVRDWNKAKGADILMVIFFSFNKYLLKFY